MENLTHYRIQVTVRVRYLSEQSDEADNRFVFAYTITVSNEGDQSVKLLARHWVITDANNHLTVDTGLFTQALNSNAAGVRRLFTPNAQGTYTYVYSTGATTSGVYDTQVVADAKGNPSMQMRRQGTSNWITMTQTGNAFDGPAGTDLAGFTMNANNIKVGDTGTMNISVGIGQQVSYRTGNYTEYSNQGAIYNVEQSLTTRYTNYQSQIDTLNMRIKKKSDDLTAKYARLESLLSTLKSQSSYLTSQLATLPVSMQGRAVQRVG